MKKGKSERTLIIECSRLSDRRILIYGLRHRSPCHTSRLFSTYWQPQSFYFFPLNQIFPSFRASTSIKMYNSTCIIFSVATSSKLTLVWLNLFRKYCTFQWNISKSTENQKLTELRINFIGSLNENKMSFQESYKIDINLNWRCSRSRSNFIDSQSYRCTWSLEFFFVGNIYRSRSVWR